eukprot:1682384-Rhodomonas_salina.2
MQELKLERKATVTTDADGEAKQSCIWGEKRRAGGEGGMGRAGREGRGEDMRQQGEKARGLARNGALGERRRDGKLWGAR